jgi:hypothetical protein
VWGVSCAESSTSTGYFTSHVFIACSGWLCYPHARAHCGDEDGYGLSNGFAYPQRFKKSTAGCLMP